MIIFLLLCFSLFGNEIIEPKLGYFVQDKYLQTLHSIFAPLTKEEAISDWGKEYGVGLYFAKELDLYQAITAFKRSKILIPEDLINRRREIDYQIINAYYLGGQFQSVIDFFDRSLLANIEPLFPAFHDLVVILYDCLKNLKQQERADRILNTMEKYFPLEKKKIEISNSILTGNLDLIKNTIEDDSISLAIASIESSLDKAFYEENGNIGKISPSYHLEQEGKLHSLYELKECKDATSDIFNEYKLKRKNPSLASGLNAVLPGLGYLYLGQKQSAFTALLLNGLTSGACYYFFKNNNFPAAILTLSFESGWYFGGIYGAKQEALFFNKRTFEDLAHYRLRDHKLYPILMLRHGF
jgi:hypothetical protein